MDNTIHVESCVGQRLKKINRSEVMKLSYKGQTLAITDVITIGRDKNNDIDVQDKLASRHHAVVQKIKSSYFIKDLESTNGTFVNGQKVPKNKFFRLHKNDVVKVGRTSLVIIV